MTKTASKGSEDRIRRLIESFGNYEAPFYSLGTPFVVDTEAARELVAMGRGAVPALIAALDDQNPKIVMLTAYCLGQIGDPSTLPALKRTRQAYVNKEPKEQYDYAVIGATGQAIDGLCGSAGA